MRQWWRKNFANYMIRPVIYKVFKRIIYAFTAALLWRRLIGSQATTPLMRANAFTFLGVLFLAMAWSSYLALDGIRSPFDGLSLLRRDPATKPPRGAFGDMADHIDVKVYTFDELSQDELQICNLLANAICAVVFLAASLM